MTWTTEKPTEPGWYWMKADSGTDSGPIVRQIVTIIGDHLYYNHPQHGAINIPNERQWAGPIPMPEEA